MHQSGNMRFSRFFNSDGDEDRPFTVFCLRLNRPGTRFSAGRVGLRPHPLAREVGKRFRKATSAEAEAFARELNTRDVNGGRDRA